MSQLPEVTGSAFETEVLKSKKPVLVDFTATWCRPCGMLAPILEDVVRTTTAIRVVAFDAGKDPEFAGTQRVTALPTLILYGEGRELGRRTGSAPKRVIEQFIQSVLEGGQ